MDFSKSCLIRQVKNQWTYTSQKHTKKILLFYETAWEFFFKNLTKQLIHKSSSANNIQWEKKQYRWKAFSLSKIGVYWVHIYHI